MGGHDPRAATDVSAVLIQLRAPTAGFMLDMLYNKQGNPLTFAHPVRAILAELFKPQLQLVCRYAEANPHVGHWAVERFLLGVTREQMGAWLMRFWHLPEEVCAALRFQHEPGQAGEHEVLARVLWLATRMLREQGIGSAPLESVPDAAYAELGISRADAHAVSERIRGATQELEAIARDLAA